MGGARVLAALLVAAGGAAGTAVADPAAPQVQAGELDVRFTELGGPPMLQGLRATQPLGAGSISAYAGWVPEFGAQHSGIAREGVGLRLEMPLTAGVKLYGVRQHYAEGAADATWRDPDALPGVQTQQQTLGLAMQRGRFGLVAEAAASRSAGGELPTPIAGHAALLRLRWSGSSLALRGGLRYQDTDFVAAASAWRQGLHELHGGLSWRPAPQAAPMLRLEAEWRRSRSRTPASAWAQAAASGRESLLLSAHGTTAWAGGQWSLQQRLAQRNDSGQRSDQRQTQLQVQHHGAQWSAQAAKGWGQTPGLWLQGQRAWARSGREAALMLQWQHQHQRGVWPTSQRRLSLHASLARPELSHWTLALDLGRHDSRWGGQRQSGVSLDGQWRLTRAWQLGASVQQQSQLGAFGRWRQTGLRGQLQAEL